MTLAVWKYDLNIKDRQEVWLPAGAQILSADLQQGELKLWVLVNPKETINVSHNLKLAGTGHNINDIIIKFIDTIQFYNGSVIMHLFEVE